MWPLNDEEVVLSFFKIFEVVTNSKDLPSRESWEHFDSESWESSDFDSFESSDSNISGRSANINHRTSDLTSRRNDSKAESNEVRQNSVTSDLYDSGSWEDSDSDTSDSKQVTDGSRQAIREIKVKDKSSKSDSIDSDSYDSDEDKKLNVLKIGSRKRWSDQRLSRDSEFGETESVETPFSTKHTIIKQQSNRKEKFRDDESFDMDSDVSARRNDRTDRMVTQNVMKRNRGDKGKNRFYWNSESSDDEGDVSNKWRKHTTLKQWSESDDEDDSFEWDSDSDVWTKPNKIRWYNKVNTVEENNLFDFDSDRGNTKRDDSVDLIKQSNLIRNKE
ncbi:unnamed protein product [Mytilus edulis]|uniref:Uncharacterized protein n=1 Tax=Mytilus edulis TaxID=6550 RepID=A0A8S3SVG5_MYTED|nr:unnamed protein product [Mytilus edulis]